jgi:hypothetical protein
MTTATNRHAYRTEHHNLDGTGSKPCRVYDLTPVTIHQDNPPLDYKDYWRAVTDVTCPCCDGGIIRWAEAGNVSGYRICDGCGRHFVANGDKDKPSLIRVGQRRSKAGQTI